MNFALSHKEYLTTAYLTDCKSVYQIAEELQSYPNKVLRALRFLNVPIRNKSESSKVALQNGRKKHPTKGTKRPDSVKLAISDARAKAWEELTSDEILDIKYKAQKRWNNLSEQKKEQIKSLSVKAIQKTAKDGSALEKFIFAELLKRGYACTHHAKILENEKLEVDLLLPTIKLAIEIDGPAHFLPIWGEESLKTHIKADNQKNGLITNRGYSILRVQCTKKSLSEKRKRDAIEAIMIVVASVEQSNQKKVIILEI